MGATQTAIRLHRHAPEPRKPPPKPWLTLNGGISTALCWRCRETYLVYNNDVVSIGGYPHVEGQSPVNPWKLRCQIMSAVPAIADIALDLLLSTITEYNPEMTTDQLLGWLKKLNEETVCNVKVIPLHKLKGWYFDGGRNLRHESGKFFSIVGVKIKTNVGLVPEWSQPIIHQPEIGILGILCQKRNDVLYFLMQAKAEPGNVNKVQLSPTVQATKSNFTRIHKGKSTLFLEYFLHPEKHRIVVDQLQSEQGARFLKKRNRNIIIEIDEKENIDVPDNYCWLTLGQIKKLLKYDNIINMDARTVLSCTQLRAPYAVRRDLLRAVPLAANERSATHTLDLLDSLHRVEDAVYTSEEIISWFTTLKMNTELDARVCNLNEVKKWVIGDNDISHVDGKYFQVIGVDVNIGTREVTRWCQPLVKPREPGIIGMIVKKINGLYHLLVQAKMEAGNFDLLEMAATVQCTTGSYLKPEYDVPYLEYFLEKRGEVLYDSVQSEEGGRFYQEQNRYMVIEVAEEFPTEAEERFIWMTLGQAKEFIKFNNYFNVEARSVISCVSPI